MNAGSYEDVISDPSCVVNGLLNQQRKSGAWNQRHCAVWKNYFLCYKDKIEIKPQAAFSLEGFLVKKCNVISDSEQNQYAFELTKPSVVTHVFEADSEDNLKQWLLKLQEIITESIPNDPSNENTEQETTNKEISVSVTAVPDEMEATSPSFSFPAVDDEQHKLRNINVNSTRIHTCLSFDSVTKVTENENPENTNAMQRSEEIEDLSCIISDYDSSDEELIMIEKNKLERQQQFQPEDSTAENEVFEENIYDFQINENEFTEEKFENTMQDNEEQIVDKVELRKHEANDEFLSTIKDRTKSLSEEVFEALGMTEEIEMIKEEESETAIKENDGNESKKEAMPIEGSIKRPTKLKFDEETNKQISIETETTKNVSTTVSVQRLKEFFQEVTTRKQQMQCRKENPEMRSRIDPLPFPQIEGFLNVISESTTPEWTKMWAALKIDHIDFRQSPNSDKSQQIIPIKGLQLQPSVWDTNRLLAFKIIRDNKVEVIVEPNDIQDFGRWVSGLFHCIQHPRNQQDVKRFATSFDLPEANSSDCEAEMKSADGADAVSVKDMRAIFENSRKGNNSSPASIHSSPSPSLASPVYDFRNQMSSTPLQQSPSRHVTPQDFDPNYADVVSWLGRYIEQEEEKQVLSSMANPFLAKLRLRHKLEMIAQIETAVTSLEENIQRLKDKLIQKIAAKQEASNKKISTGLIRSAEDAKRAGNESKRMDKECADIHSQIHQSENQLEEMRNAAYELQHEIEMAYEQFDWGKENGHKNNPISEQDSDLKRDKVDKKLVMPDWTKNSQETTQAWQNIGNNVK